MNRNIPIDIQLPEELHATFEAHAALYNMTPEELMRLLVLNDAVHRGEELEPDVDAWRLEMNAKRDSMDAECAKYSRS